jgi:thiol-disulfide isomerase/thioredoxin
MKRSFLLLVIVVAFAANAPAQSGRRITNPPMRVEPATVSEPPIVSEPDYTPVAPAEMSALPETLVNHQIQAVDHGSFRLADFAGRVIVVNVWATWCGPCRREAPDYEKVRKEFAGRAVEFIGLTTEDPRTSTERVQKFARDLNFHFRLGWADPQTARVLMNGRNVIPQTLVIAPDGRLISHWRGYSATQSRDRLRDIVEHALSEVSAQK